MMLDQDGTPPRRIYYPSVAPRLISELIGLAKGMICDGVVTPEEAAALRRWLANHPDVAVSFPGKHLAERLTAIFADGIVDAAEQEELRVLLDDLVGEGNARETSGLDHATRLPVDDPPPTIIFDGREFVFTGAFAWGSRRQLENAVADRGGRAAPRVTRKTDMLVIGMFASPAWFESTHGRKIERAMEIRDQGFPLSIVAEEHWVQAIEYDAR